MSTQFYNDTSEEKKLKVNDKYKMVYHMTPSVGWMNDPNGLIYYGGKYHLFYQSNPYASTFGVMHWGHFVSEDLISYRDAGIALAPDKEGENIFSGGAIEYDGGLALVYTMHFEKDGVKYEDIHCALSDDGMSFKKAGCIFDNETLPENISRTDFRDPCPAKIDGEYVVFVGGKDKIKNQGLIVVLGGEDLFHLKYRFTIGPFYELGDMGECPSYHKVDGKDVIVVSGCNVPQRGNDFKNINSSVAIVGRLDMANEKLEVESIAEIDKGDSFYAPQFINGTDTPTIVGWLDMWGKRYPTHEWGHGWIGAFTIPRELSVSDGRIVQSPSRSLEKYLCDSDVPSASMLFKAEIGRGGAIELYGDNGSVVIGNEGGIYLDTMRANNLNGCVRSTNFEYGRCEVLVLVDVSGIELFVDGGREVISGRMFMDGQYKLSCRGDAEIINIKTIRVKK